ncbi:MAG: oxidoreductase [Chitinophagaceae bacterium]|nr:oxidoreductase [Chitinophagaceae bacterium]
MRKVFFLILATGSLYASAQKIEVLDSNKTVSIRGLSVVDNQTIWISGSGGTVALSVDGGKSFTWKKVEGYEKVDFRDIEAFDAKTAVIMGTASPAYILRTEDGGDTWARVYENTDSSMFLDAMEFWNDVSGIVIGDPKDGKFFIGRTFDGGKTWQTIPDQFKPSAAKGEACFAASGTNVRKLKRDEAVFISGGTESNLFIRDKKIKLPILQGKESMGANSIAVKNSKTMIVVGGDFTRPSDTTGNCAITFDAGESWVHPATPPAGYRSCVEYLKKDDWIACGLTGVDISHDNGTNWTNISMLSFHVVRKAKKGKAVFLAGSGGKIARLIP